MAARGARAATCKVYRIAVASPTSPVGGMREGADNPHYDALSGELRRLGCVEGHNLVADRYSAEGRPERYAALANEVTRTEAGPDNCWLQPIRTSAQGATELAREVRPIGRGARRPRRSSGRDRPRGACSGLPTSEPDRRCLSARNLIRSPCQPAKETILKWLGRAPWRS